VPTTLILTQTKSGKASRQIAFNYDEDTMSLVKKSTLIILEVSLPDSSNFSAGNAPIAFEYYCYDIKLDAP
jgi:hypothetical protein